MADTVKIQVQFRKTYNGMDYNDALYFTQEEYNSITADEIESMKTQRFEAWKTAITTEPKTNPEEETKESLEQMEQALLLQKSNIELNLSDLRTKISSKDVGVISEK